ncbi:ABC transporter ATP-binding protein [Streptomyces sp. DSM 42041]|uniref:ABC transporter ATP-binding protein n=1 Tax=Streptomyces hazeniae TaxID=3075538 RepID=A0ABU2P046_9ACTN|nr:ABC transporter ATP-binding protein [Streptomyces sp. DSM 42041]MDT0382616.1 ABC transporter ATP-binding protein [Streptomyces sp. DSM 42041]
MNIREIAARHRLLLGGGIVLGLLGAAASLAQPWLIGRLVEAVAGDESLAWPIALIALMFTADAVFAAGHAYLIGRAGENIVHDMRQLLVGRLLRADTAAFARLDRGDVFTRVVTDTSSARIPLSQALAQIVTHGFTVVGGMTLMALIDWRLLLLTVGCLGGASLVSLVLARRVRRASLTNREDTGAFGSGVQRVMSALSTVKAFRAEQRESERVGGLADTARRSGARVHAYSAMFTPAMNVGTQLSLAVVIGWGMTRVATGSMPLADLTAFVMYLFYLVSPLVLLFLAIGQLQQGRAAITRVSELAAVPQEEAGPAEPVVPARAPHAGPGPAPAVRFDHVSFGYGEDADVLRDVTFTVPERGLTAIVGPSGAGKTTVLQLIERFYRHSSGTVQVGGTDVAAMPLDRLRGMIGYVEQQSSLMRGTVRDNLTYAAPDASDDDIARAVTLAGLRDVLAALPDGLDTELGEAGHGLSGGQAQRLAVARALLTRPRVVLLDEASSHLDSNAEAALRDALAGVAADCAVVTVAHRISTIAEAERILVLEDGRIRADGTHHDLLATDDLYRRLVSQQLDAVGAPG